MLNKNTLHECVRDDNSDIYQETITGNRTVFPGLHPTCEEPMFEQNQQITKKPSAGNKNTYTGRKAPNTSLLNTAALGFSAFLTTLGRRKIRANANSIARNTWLAAISKPKPLTAPSSDRASTIRTISVSKPSINKNHISQIGRCSWAIACVACVLSIHHEANKITSSRANKPPAVSWITTEKMRGTIRHQPDLK